MPRKYHAIWQAIKTADVSVGVEVKCHWTAVKTLKQAVFKEKSMETAQRKKVGMLYAGKLDVTERPAKDPDYVIVCFKLQWDGTRL